MEIYVVDFFIVNRTVTIRGDDISLLYFSKNVSIYRVVVEIDKWRYIKILVFGVHNACGRKNNFF